MAWESLAHLQPAADLSAAWRPLPDCGASVLSTGTTAVLPSLTVQRAAGPLADVIAAQAFSFPSGHAMVACAFYLFVAYLGWHLLPGWWRAIAIACLLALVLLIGFSRLYLGVHYLTDVVAGYLAGFIWTDAVIIGGRVIFRRAPADRPHWHSPPS